MILDGQRRMKKWILLNENIINKDRIINTYEVGDYQIIEYTTYNPHGKLLYSPYIDYSDTHRIYNSLDAALLGVMAYKYEGCNYHADEYMCKLLGIKW